MAGLIKSKMAIFLALVVLLLVAAYAYYSSTHPSGSFRYKMTVEVETPEGLKTGSAVREVQLRTGPGFMGVKKRGYARVLGEAVVVDLGKRGVLFVLLGGDSDYYEIFSVFPFSGSLTPNGVRYYSHLKKGGGVLDISRFPGSPLMIAFRNLADPRTAQVVFQTESYDVKTTAGMTRRYRAKEDNFEKIFGAGVKLKRITLAVTDEPVTWSIKNRLPWLSEYYSRKFDGLRYNTASSRNTFANTLSSGAFSTGEKR